MRNVSNRTHGELKRRAKARGQTLTAYIQEILEREVARPTKEEVFAQIRNRPPIVLDVPAAEIIREARREAGLEG